jgi:hypothetical protein
MYDGKASSAGVATSVRIAAKDKPKTMACDKGPQKTAI